MLVIPFSHRYIKMPQGLGLLQSETILLNYSVVDSLSQEFIEYDTAILGGGHFKLPPKGPYLILFLKTITHVIREGVPACSDYWTTVRCPWRMGYQQCVNDQRDAICDLNCRKPRTHDRPMRCTDWKPNVPAKYREARGKEVNIVIEKRVK